MVAVEGEAVVVVLVMDQNKDPQDQEELLHFRVIRLLLIEISDITNKELAQYISSNILNFSRIGIMAINHKSESCSEIIYE